MSPSKRRYFSGNSMEQAVMAAACHYHVAPDRIAYERVEKRHGFLRIRRRVVIEVDPENLLLPEGEHNPLAEVKPGGSRGPLPAPKRQEKVAQRPGGEGRERRQPERPRERAPERTRERTAARAPGRESPQRAGRPQERPAGGASEEELAAAAKEALKPILRLAGLELAAEVEWADDRLEVNLSGPDRRRLLAEEGEVLEAVEYLLPRVMRRVAGESVGCRVDSGNYRKGREDELRSLALRAADAVRQRGREMTLETMNPAERRIVHLALAEVEDVTTESEGEGYFKRVVVRRA